MALTISSIFRAVCFSGVSLANLSHVVVLSDVWQSVQFMLVAAENIPIVSMNSSTGIPLMIWRFLKTSSAIWGLGAWP